MRLSEKTLELTFCHQFGSFIAPDLVWFGLTQRQEAIAGFDACARVNGRLLIFQFKASSYVLKNGRRRFHAHHDQMVALRDRCKAQRGIYYVFPLIGTTQEISANPAILPYTWLLDVADLPKPIPKPLTRYGTDRKSKIHYVDVVPYSALINSELFEVSLLNSREFAHFIKTGHDQRLGIEVHDKRDFWELRKIIKRNAIAVIIKP